LHRETQEEARWETESHGTRPQGDYLVHLAQMITNTPQPSPRDGILSHLSPLFASRIAAAKASVSESNPLPRPSKRTGGKDMDQPWASGRRPVEGRRTGVRSTEYCRYPSITRRISTRPCPYTVRNRIPFVVQLAASRLRTTAYEFGQSRPHQRGDASQSRDGPQTALRQQDGVCRRDGASRLKGHDESLSRSLC